MQEKENAALVLRLQAGDETAFDELYAAYAHPAVRTAALISKDAHLAQDIAQEAFVLCMLKIRQLKNPLRFRSWFYRILVRCAWKMTTRRDESHSLETVKTYEAMSALAEKTIPNARHVQRFENGYAFVRGGTREISTPGSDEKHIGLTLGYQNEQHRDLALYIDTQIGDVQPGYRSDACKFVPPDYAPTEEEQAQQEAGELFISYGSDVVELQQLESYFWQDGDLCYNLIAFDCSLGEAAMIAMAAEITG